MCCSGDFRQQPMSNEVFPVRQIDHIISLIATIQRAGNDVMMCIALAFVRAGGEW